MAKTRIVVNQKAIDQIVRSPAVQADLMRRAGAIASACNRESSWGGYEVDGEIDSAGAGSRVYSIDEAGDSERANRIIRNLDAGR